jgi:hypothetical protein
MKDIERFSQVNPRATKFDWEIFQIGWSAGIESDYRNTRTSEMVENRT